MSPAGQRAVFLDRDGTIIEDVGYVRDPDDVRLLPGAAGALRKLQAAGLTVVVVTNQSGIARGLLSDQDFQATQERMLGLLAEQGAGIAAAYVCPHHPEIDGACECRKPAAGLYRRAASDLSVDLSASFYVGDRWRDVAVTREVGGTPILVATGDPCGATTPTEVPRVPGLDAAADLILKRLEEEG